MRLLSSALALSLLSSAAMADIQAVFREGAPKDRFSWVNTSACATGPITLALDLSGSAAGLIFDVTGDGAGVEVFQPFDLVSGADFVTGASRVADGDSALVLELSDLPAGAEVAFTIDVDDTIGAREITVSRSEIIGAATRVTAGEMTVEGVFSETAQAQVALNPCG